MPTWRKKSVPENRTRPATRILLALGFGVPLFLFPPLPAPAELRPRVSVSDAVEKDPNAPRGLRIRRARRTGEKWPTYFCEVLLWPYTKEHINRLFTTMSEKGQTIRFIPGVVFEVDEEWILVLQGEEEACALMGKHVALELVGGGSTLRPVRTTVVRCPETQSWTAFVAFARPNTSRRRVMSSFSLFGNAGGVADVLTEEEVRQRYKVLRDIVDVIVEDILK